MLRVRTEFGCGASKATIWVRSFFRNNPQIWLGAMQTTEPFTSLLRLRSIGCERKHEVSFPIYRSEPVAVHLKSASARNSARSCPSAANKFGTRLRTILPLRDFLRNLAERSSRTQLNETKRSKTK